MEKETIEQEPHPDYVSGFNEGYFLAQEMPQFANDMAKHMPESDRGAGFGQGIEQYSLELDATRQNELRKDFAANSRDIDLGKNELGNRKVDFKENKLDMNVSQIDKVTEWLKDKDTNKTDMGLDINRGRDAKEKEPEID